MVQMYRCCSDMHDALQIHHPSHVTFLNSSVFIEMVMNFEGDLARQPSHTCGAPVAQNLDFAIPEILTKAKTLGRHGRRTRRNLLTSRRSTQYIKKQ